MSRSPLAPIVPTGLFRISPFDDFDRVFSNMVEPFSTPWEGRGTKCDVKETETGFEITADFPGAAKEDISVDVEDGRLYLTYETKTEKDEENAETGYVVKERSFRSFKRTFELGDVDETSAKATLTDGVLSITIDKKEPEVKKTSISID